MKERLDMLIAAGVKKARFEGENLVEVEFFSATPSSGDEAGDSHGAEQGEDEFSESLRALNQVKTRRFAGRDASAGGES
jgi:hypothetical protein